MVKIIHHNKVIDNITPTPTLVNHSASIDDDQFKQLSLNNTSNSKVIHHANCICEPLISPTKTPTSTATPTRTPANSSTPTPTITPTITPTSSPTLTVTRTPTSSQPPTPTLTSSRSPTPTPTATPPSSPCPPCPSQTPPPTPTRTSSPTPTPTPSSPENCCEWDGNGYIQFGYECNNLLIPVQYTQVGLYTWSASGTLECGDTFASIITCNPSIPYTGPESCDTKWKFVLTISCVNGLTITGIGTSCQCNVPPIWNFSGDASNCNCCSPTPTPTPTITPSSSYNYYSYFANIIP